MIEYLATAKYRRTELRRGYRNGYRYRGLLTELGPIEQTRAVRCIEDDLDELLPFLDCPQAHWRKVRTTNAIERAFREVRRRTRLIGLLSELSQRRRDHLRCHLSHEHQLEGQAPSPIYTQLLTLPGEA